MSDFVPDGDELLEVFSEINARVNDSQARFVSYMALADKLTGVLGETDADDEAIHDAMLALVRAHHEIDALRSAALALYMAGRWTAGLPNEAAMWERLRDALGLPMGTATSAGVAGER